MRVTPKQGREPALFLLADAGATHVRAVVTDAEGALLGQGHAGPANAFAVGEHVALANVLRSMRDALASGNVRRKDITVALVGSASVDHDGKGSAPIETALRGQLPRARVRVVADALIALEGAQAGTPGVVIVSGTGSVVLAKGSRGEVFKVGGWGPLLGDEGSAQWVARQALQAAAHATDGTGPPTRLVKVFRRHFNLRTFERIIDVVYQHPMTPAELGVLAPQVARAARREDAVAVEIFCQAGCALASQAAQAIRRLGTGQVRVSYQGSMFRVGKILLDPLRRSLRGYAPEATLVKPVLPPIGGAFLLALKCAGLNSIPKSIVAFQHNCRV